MFNLTSYFNDYRFFFNNMPRKACYWTRKLELELVEFIHNREFVWKSSGNTNHHIHRKYKAYAEFAAIIGRGFTARSVRDRWVNIRSTFNHNLRKVERSKAVSTTTADVYVPCWPLWKPLQFLREIPRKEGVAEESPSNTKDQQVKEELYSEMDDIDIGIRQRADRTDRPHWKERNSKPKTNQCIKVLDDLIRAIRPLVKNNYQEQSYWFFGKHVTERLNCMRDVDANCASQEIMELLRQENENLKTEFVTSDYLNG